MTSCNKNEEISLKDYGIRATEQRKLILDLLQTADAPRTAEQFFFEARNQDDAINLSTVYRILSVFTDKGIAIKNILGESNTALFELNRMEHKHHLICLGCHKIQEIHHCPLENYEKELSSKTQYEIISHKLEIYGYCPTCKAKR